MHDYHEALNLAQVMQASSAAEIGKGTLAVFYDRPVPDPKETKRQGRQVFKTKTFVQVRVPADKNSVVDEPLRSAYSQPTDDPRLRWPAAWRVYCEKGSAAEAGTPIEQWPLLNVTQVAELRHIHINTIEALALVSDGNLPALGPGARELRDRARQFLQGSSETEKELRGVLDDQARTIEQLKAQVSQLAENAKPAKAPAKSDA